MTFPKTQYKPSSFIKDIKEKEIQVHAKRGKPIDWGFYNVAQLNEMNDFLNLIRELGHIDHAMWVTLQSHALRRQKQFCSAVL